MASCLGGAKDGVFPLTLETGNFLQRLFSTFPDGWPGAGLLLLRVGAAITLIGFADPVSTSLDYPVRLALQLAAFAGAILLLSGLWTPFIGALVAVAETWSGFLPGPSHPNDQWVHFLLAILAGSVAMLGPGAWSLDAHLFGRKRFELSGTRRRR